MSFPEAQAWLSDYVTNVRTIEVGVIVVAGVASVLALSKAISMYWTGIAVEEALMRSGPL
ncbi:hypothetical protein CPLU01_02592 [Colletotrichum plurivorum]|uniref:Uncharacterized protein n=1 Tax=Colletotrichum plurivorum TaxID=2175906 RepID=A0A8H6NMU5_9PEZI|nr:hypothetical protein CPLU01_02592 [Colletotrichum plurivorum]